MNLFLSKLTLEDEQEFVSFHKEFINFGGRIYPGILNAFQSDFPALLEKIKRNSDEKLLPAGFVAADTYVLKDENGRIYGMSVLRRKLTEGLLLGGGHIGYGIRPSERGKGYGTKQLELLIEKCKEFDIKRVLITVDKDNYASAKVAVNNGAVLWDEILETDGNILQRYWITLSKEEC